MAGNGSCMSSGGLRGRTLQTTRSLRAGQEARITYNTRHYLYTVLGGVIY